MGETKPKGSTATKLTRIAQLSGEDPEMKFVGLMPHFNKESLTECFNELDGKKAVGADGRTKEEYGSNLEANIEDLINRMKRMGYRPGPLREVLIPKEGKRGAFRPLGISGIEDKIVQKMMSKVLTAIYEPIFRDCSYGFRPNRSCHTAIKALDDHLFKNECEVVIDVDLKNFFGTIDHRKLLDILRVKIKDERFVRYVGRMLKSGILGEQGVVVTEEGTPQGNVASPVLANIYAHYALDGWFENVVKRHVRGKAEMFRYCDDIVICCRYRGDAERIGKALGGRLGKYSLELNEEKTKLVPFSKKAFDRGVKQGTFDFLGFTFYLSRTMNRLLNAKVKTSRKRMRTKLQKVNHWCRNNRNKEKLIVLWKVFTSKLRGHVQYYAVSFNAPSVKNFLYQAVRIFFKWMNRRSQKRSMSWEQFAKFLARHPIPKVRVVHPLY